MCESENKRNEHGSGMNSCEERRFQWFTDSLRLCVIVCDLALRDLHSAALGYNMSHHEAQTCACLNGEWARECFVQAHLVLAASLYILFIQIGACGESLARVHAHEAMRVAYRPRGREQQ